MTDDEKKRINNMRKVIVEWNEKNQSYSVYWVENGEVVAEEGFIFESESGIPLYENDVKFLRYQEISE